MSATSLPYFLQAFGTADGNTYTWQSDDGQCRYEATFDGDTIMKYTYTARYQRTNTRITYKDMGNGYIASVYFSWHDRNENGCDEVTYDSRTGKFLATEFLEHYMGASEETYEFSAATAGNHHSTRGYVSLLMSKKRLLSTRA